VPVLTWADVQGAAGDFDWRAVDNDFVGCVEQLILVQARRFFPSIDSSFSE
jgi:hypothetical protein